MKKLLILAFAFILLPTIALSYTDTTGSTDTTTTGGLDPKDIIRIVYDSGIGCIKVCITSGTVEVTMPGIINSSDTLTHTRLLSILGEMKNVALSSGVVTVIYDVQRSSAWVQNFPSDYPDASAQSLLSSIETIITTIYESQISSVPVVNKYFENRVSTGSAGILTGVTSATVSTAAGEEATSWHIIYRNLVNTEDVATVTDSITGDVYTFFDGHYEDIIIDIPQGLTLEFTLPVESTVTYRVTKVTIP